VVLEDVARAGIPERALDALARWVAGGGALIATGGAHLFGDGGFAGTALERVLPVELRSERPEPKEREPIALYLLIDRSNSMGYASGPNLPYGAKMEYAKRAALAVVEQLGPRDLVGAIAFDSEPYELSPLLPLAEGHAALTATIRQLQAGGGAALAGIAEDELPKVSRWAITRPKPGAEVRLWVEAGERQDPLLATWQYELGRTAALPIDFQAGGAAWPTWRGFAKLWSQLTMWAAPHGLAADRHLEARRLREGTWLRLEAIAGGAGPFHLRV